MRKLHGLIQFGIYDRQRLRARGGWLGRPDLAAGSNVQHPERDLQNPTSLDVFQAAMRHRLASLYETGMHPHCPAVPWMPPIADFTDVANMGVVLLSCITRNETTKARTICCCSRSLQGRQVRGARSVLESGSVAYSSITAAPHEYFHHKRCDGWRASGHRTSPCDSRPWKRCFRRTWPRPGSARCCWLYSRGWRCVSRWREFTA